MPHKMINNGNRFGGKDVIADDGRGVRFDANGIFGEFLEPWKPISFVNFKDQIN